MSITTTTKVKATTGQRRTTKTKRVKQQLVPARQTIMSATVSQADLHTGIMRAMHAVAAKATLPVLEHVLLIAEAGKLMIAATDLELGVCAWVSATVEVEGAITVPAQLLADVISSLGESLIELDLDGCTRTLRIRAFTEHDGQRRLCSESNIRGFEAEEFPTLPLENSALLFTTDTETMRMSIARTAFATTSESSRPTLTALRLGLHDHTISFWAGDGFRAAMLDVALAQPVFQTRELLIPGRAAALVVHILVGLHSALEVGVLCSGSSILLRTPDLAITLRLVEGVFPNLRAIIPSNPIDRFEVDVKDFKRVLKMASFIASTSENKAVHLTYTLPELPDDETHTKGQIFVRTTAEEVGMSCETLEIQSDGGSNTIRLFLPFLQDGINALRAERVGIDIVDEETALVLRGVGNAGFTYVLSPMSEM